MSTDPPARKPFAAWLREQSAGRTHDELTEALADLVAAVADTGKKGSISLTVTVAPLDKGGTALVVTDAVKRTIPIHDRKRNVFYADAVGNLSREDPNQPALDGLRAIPATPQPKELHA